MSEKLVPSGGPVWSKRVGDEAVASANVDFCAGFDVRGRPAADERLTLFDLETNAAHLLMLVEESIIPAEPGSAAAGALLKLRERFMNSETLVLPSCEDIHMSIESLVTDAAGEDAGGRLHTARSRNDQVATDMRLWLRREVAALALEAAALGETIADHAASHLATVCPGFTHGQPAMVTSWGHWTMSYAARVVRDARAVAILLDDLVECPLGAAASFGTSWPVNRERTASLLGFERPTTSGADGIWSRGEMETRFAFAAAGFLSHLAGMAQDLILLSTPPREWLRLADEHVTGSSIMPQKRNPDFAEVTRARAAHAFGIVQSLAGIGSGLPSGYNRDTQWTKYLGFDAADNVEGAARLYASVFRGLRIDKDAMKAGCEVGFLNATDVADFLARERRVPFRRCYRIVGPAVKACEAEGRLVREKLNAELEREGIDPLGEEEWRGLEDPVRLLMARSQPGNPHPDQVEQSIEALRGELGSIRDDVAKRVKGWQAAEKHLWDLLRELSD